MLQRALAGLYRLEGVKQAMLIDDSGNLLASVGDEGAMPPFEHAVDVVSAALESADALGLGAVYEVWCEGEERCCIANTNCRVVRKRRASCSMASCPRQGSPNLGHHPPVS